MERAQERDYLVRLHEDIVESIRGLERDIAFLEDQLSFQAHVLDALDNCVVDEEVEEIVQLGFATLGYVNPPRFFRRTVDELASAGRLDLLQNAELKAELARVVALVEFRENVRETVFRRLEHHLLIVQEQLRFDLSVLIQGDKYLSSVRGDYPSVHFDIRDLCEQPRYANAVSAVSFVSRDRLNVSNELLALYINFLPTIETELRARWGYEIEGE